MKSVNPATKPEKQMFPLSLCYSTITSTKINSSAFSISWFKSKPVFDSIRHTR